MAGRHSTGRLPLPRPCYSMGCATIGYGVTGCNRGFETSSISMVSGPLVRVARMTARIILDEFFSHVYTTDGYGTAASHVVLHTYTTCYTQAPFLGMISRCASADHIEGEMRQLLFAYETWCRLSCAALCSSISITRDTAAGTVYIHFDLRCINYPGTVPVKTIT